MYCIVLSFALSGIVRAKANVAMTNLTYNTARLIQIYRYHKERITVQMFKCYVVIFSILPPPHRQKRLKFALKLEKVLLNLQKQNHISGSLKEFLATR
ncbi:MAG: hypothetical protein E7081_04895 [Bacteroidales bacterium]|nr:hypothetical protein [Bacteroidales bacterium]